MRKIEEVDADIHATEKTIATLGAEKERTAMRLADAKSLREQHALAALITTDEKSQAVLAKARER